MITYYSLCTTANYSCDIGYFSGVTESTTVVRMCVDDGNGDAVGMTLTTWQPHETCKHGVKTVETVNRLVHTQSSSLESTMMLEVVVWGQSLPLQASLLSWEEGPGTDTWGPTTGQKRGQKRVDQGWTLTRHLCVCVCVHCYYVLAYEKFRAKVEEFLWYLISLWTAFNVDVFFCNQMGENKFLMTRTLDIRTIPRLYSTA